MLETGNSSFFIKPNDLSKWQTNDVWNTAFGCPREREANELDLLVRRIIRYHDSDLRFQF